MGYCGENNLFSFRDGYCETLPEIALTSAAASEFGRILSRFFVRFSVGCDSFGYNHILYAICCGISEGGKEAYVCENTDLPSFLFGFPLISSDCGIYISKTGGAVKISVFNGKRFPVSDKLLTQILNSEPPEPAKKSGKLISTGSFREIYVNNIADSLENTASAISAGVTCGNRSTRSLWGEFFTGSDDNLVFQISDDGRKVNAYSSEHGFISYDKLVLAFTHLPENSGKTIFLPEDFHYGADFVTENGNIKIIRFNPEEDIPDKAAEQRFLWDPLYLCTHLASDRNTFLKIMKEIPSIISVSREVTASFPEKIYEKRCISEKETRIIISRSGKNRAFLTVQSFKAETASEICGRWADKIRKGDF